MRYDTAPAAGTNGHARDPRGDDAPQSGTLPMAAENAELTLAPRPSGPRWLARRGTRYLAGGRFASGPAEAQEFTSSEEAARAVKEALAGSGDRPAMAFAREFARAGEDPYLSVTWGRRSARITDDAGRVIFEQDGLEFPDGWSQLAVNVVSSKFFYGRPGDPDREHSLRHLVGRVAAPVAAWGYEDGYFRSRADAEAFRDDLIVLLLGQYASFNSPVWFNVGLSDAYGIRGSAQGYRWDPAAAAAVPCEDAYRHPQASACFIQSVKDDMGSIMDLARSEALLFKYGSGSGTDLSTLRSTRERLSGGGRPSGPVSFMRIYDAVASVVKSGGKTRRAAKMQTLKDWHPDVLEFVRAKSKEELKARALVAGGFDGSVNGDAYGSVLFQNCNMSLRVSDEFMKRANGWSAREDWPTVGVTTGEHRPEYPTYRASDLLDEVARGTWLCGDPGLQYEDTIRRWHTCPDTAPINSSNPCSEYMFIDESACNLASLNLMRFRIPGGKFDARRFRAAVRVLLTAQEILVDRASYPTEGIARNSHDFRPLGLGYANLGALVMASGLPYDSEPARDLAGAVTALMHAQACLTSAELAAARGPFAGFAENRGPMLGVMVAHRAAAWNARAALAGRDADRDTERLWDEASEVMDLAVDAGAGHGYRNAQVTLLAPTGTIAFMMDCDTTGVEPDIALVKYKTLAGGGLLKIANGVLPEALRSLGYEDAEAAPILAYVEANDTIEGAPGLRGPDLPVFDCAFPPPRGGRSIDWRGHVRMMAAVQPFLSGAISKTVNMPRESTPEQIRDAYVLGWELGLKAMAVFRDGSKGCQPVNTSAGGGDAGGAAAAGEGPTAGPERERLPDTRSSLTHHFEIARHDGYVTVGFYPDGRPGEVFVKMAKEGSTLAGLMDSLGTAVSIGLQYGVPLGVFARKFAHYRFEPAGFTKNPDVPIAKSLVDYVFRWLGLQFVPGYRGGDTDGPPPHLEPVAAGSDLAAALESADALRAPRPAEPGRPQGPPPARPPGAQSDAPPCDNCGALTVRCGTCYRCYNCGNSLGCS